MATKGLEDLFLETLKDVFYAEQESAAESERLRNAFAQLRGETLAEESSTDELLTDIADAMANVKATAVD